MKDRLETRVDYFNYLNRRVPEELDADISEKYVEAVSKHFFDMKYNEETVLALWNAILKYGTYRKEIWK